MRVAVFGGSFNPPHVGHAMVAAWLRWTERVDEVWLVPAYQHAFDKPLVPFGRRVEACRRLAALVGPDVSVSGIEATLPTPSYTIQTLDALRAAHPRLSFSLVVGADNRPHLPNWREWDRIAAEYSPIFVGRGDAVVEGSPCFPDVSSTEVRNRLQRGESVAELLPGAVLAAWRGTEG